MDNNEHTSDKPIFLAVVDKMLVVTVGIQRRIVLVDVVDVVIQRQPHRTEHLLPVLSWGSGGDVIHVVCYGPIPRLHLKQVPQLLHLLRQTWNSKWGKYCLCITSMKNLKIHMSWQMRDNWF